VAISIGGYSVIVKKISIQAMSEEELNEAINHEAEQYIPFDISEVNVDFQILGEAEINPEQMNVLLVAAKKEMIAEYIELVQSAGLNPCIIDVDAFALQNIFEINYDLPNEAVALIDIGAGKTSLNIVKDESSLFMRDVSLGCHQINEHIMSTLDCSDEDAEAIKIDKKQNKMAQEEYSEIISSVTANWCDEIRKALDYYYSTDPEDTIQRIILSGGGTHISGLKEMLASELSTEVESINPFGTIDTNSKKIDPAYLQQIAPQAAICLGLALRRVDDK
jgi:type IV pilus assembly protein PilM